jgi:hypothetical protein
MFSKVHRLNVPIVTPSPIQTILSVPESHRLSHIAITYVKSYTGHGLVLGN